MVKEYRIPADMEVHNELDDCVWVASYGPEKSRFIWANNAACKIWGTENAEMFAAKDISTGRSEAVKKIHEQMYSSIQARGQVLRERRTLYPNKKAIVFDLVFKPMHARIACDNNEEITEVVVLVHAVPLKEKGAQEANRSHEMLRHSPVLSMLFSPEGALLGENFSAKTFYGENKSEGEINGTSNGNTHELSLSDVFASCEFDTAAQREALLEKCKQLRPGAKSLHLECKKMLPQQQGEERPARWHMMQCIPTYDPCTGSPALLINESDISQLQQLKKAHEEQEAAMRQQEQFFAAVSHELRTPLNGIIGLSESLFTDEDLEPTVAETMRVIHASGQRLSRLVNDILDAASLKHRNMELKMDRVCLEQVVETVCDMTSTLAKPGVKLVNAVPPLPQVDGDFGRLTQVVTNLVGNALKFTLDGSVIVSGYTTEESVVLEVKDTGIGIPESKLEDIFVAFEQVDMSATRKFEGTGLGLAIVKSMVEAHGGTIGVKSSTRPEDHGSSFSIVFPKGDKSLCNGANGDSTNQILDQAALADGSASQSPFSISLPMKGPRVKDPVPLSSQIELLEEEKRRMQQRLVELADELETLMSTAGSKKGSGVSTPKAAPESSSNGVHEQQEKLPLPSPKFALQSPKVEDSKLAGQEVTRIATGDDTGSTTEGELSKIGLDTEQKSLTVLTIDDNPVNQMMIQNALRPHCFAVVCCKDGPEALRFLQQRTKPPDVILLDLMMPGMSGLDVVKEIRAQFPPLAVPVLMISAKSGDAYIEQGLRMGCNDYITKPFSTRELVARIQAQLKIRQLLTIELEQKSPKPCAPAGDGDVQPKLDGTLQIVDKFSDASVLMVQVMHMDRRENIQSFSEHTKFITEVGAVFVACCEASNIRKVDVSDFDLFMGVIGQREGHDEPQHADKAVAAGTRMLQELLQVRTSLGTRLPVRVAIGSGEVFSGQRGGAPGRVTLVGDAVAKSRMMKDVCPSDCMLVGQETLSQLTDKTPFEPFPMVQVPSLQGSFKAEKAFIAKLGPYESQLAAVVATLRAPETPTATARGGGDEEPPIPFYSALHTGREIMSIDDTHVNHMVLERIFTKESFVFTSCTSGIAALDLIHERQYLPDCILLDVMMPEMSGIEVCSRIRDLYGRQVPVLLISAKSDEDNILSGFQAGCDDYVTKPFKRKELVARVQSRCHKPLRGSAAPPEDSVSDLRASPLVRPVPFLRPASTSTRLSSVDSVVPVHPTHTLVCVQLAPQARSAHLQGPLERAVQAVGEVAERHRLRHRSSPLAPWALMASTGAGQPAAQAKLAMAAAMDVLKAAAALPNALQVRVGVLAFNDCAETCSEDIVAVGAGAATAAALLLDGCQADNVVVSDSVAKLLDAEEYRLRACGVVPAVTGHHAEERHFFVSDGTKWDAMKSLEGRGGKDESHMEWAICAMQARAAAEHEFAVATQDLSRKLEAAEQQLRSHQSSMGAPVAVQSGCMREGDGGVLLIEDVPGDSDFIDRVARCVVVEGLPSVNSSTRRTMASVMSKFGTLQTQLEVRSDKQGACLTLAEYDSEASVQAAAKKLDGAMYNGARLRASALLPNMVR